MSGGSLDPSYQVSTPPHYHGSSRATKSESAVTVSVVAGRLKSTVISVDVLRNDLLRVTAVTVTGNLPPHTPVVVSAAALNSTSF